MQQKEKKGRFCSSKIPLNFRLTATETGKLYGNETKKKLLGINKLPGNVSVYAVSFEI